MNTSIENIVVYKEFTKKKVFEQLMLYLWLAAIMADKKCWS